jgi:hypothetical protein
MMRNHAAASYIRGVALSFFLCVGGALAAEQYLDGFVITDASRFSSSEGELMGGSRSIVGTNSDGQLYAAVLRSDPALVKLSGGESYTVRFRYKVLSAPERGCEFIFYSPTAGKADKWLPGKIFGLKPGETGVIEFRGTLLDYGDYELLWNVIGKGSIALDDISVTRDFVDTVGATAFEEPEIKQGVLRFSVSAPVTMSLGSEGQDYVLRSMAMRDLDGDGKAEAAITISTYQDQLPEPIILLGAKPGPVDLTRRLLPGGTPRLRHSPYTYFADLDGDGRDDIVFAEAGLDHEPWTGSRIVVLLASANGSFRDVSDKIPAEYWGTRSYAIGVGDYDNDGRPEILLPDQTPDGKKFDCALLSWKNGRFVAARDWIDRALWYWPSKFYASNGLGSADLDKDGKTELLAGGGWERPNTRIIWGSAKGLIPSNVLTLPDGPFGHTEWEEWTTSGMPSCQGADANTIVAADFDKDGNQDLLLLQEQILSYKPGAITDANEPEYAYSSLLAQGGGTGAQMALQVFMNRGNRNLVDYSAASSQTLLGRRYYSGNVVRDLDGDGFPDVAAIYWTKPYAGAKPQSWGTTFFLNDGTGAFRVVDGSEILPHWQVKGEAQPRQLGAFLPTFIARNRTEGLFVEVDSDYKSGILYARSGWSDSALGTGPGFADSAALGYPGFNESYYVRNHPDAASALSSGQYANGLEHYKAVGQRRGYQAFAANAEIRGGEGRDVLILACAKRDVRIRKAEGAVLVADSSGKYGTLRLEGIEAIRCSDGDISL